VCLICRYDKNNILYTFSGLTAATVWTILLPNVKNNEPKSDIEKLNVMNNTNKLKENELEENTIEDNKWKYIKSMFKEYENLYVLKWSFWVITATCCFNQVLYYIQSLWVSLSHNDECLQNVCSTTEWNGAIDAIYTILSTLITFLCGSIKLNMNKYGNIIIMITMIVQCITLYTPTAYNSIYISYINFIVYCSIYQGMMTIASSEIAKCVNKDKHGFVFGVNNFLATALQSFATFFMNIGGLSLSKILFQWYAMFCLAIGVCYLFITVRQVIKK